MHTQNTSLLNQETINRLMTWMLSGETGLSSECLAATIMSNGTTLSIQKSAARQHPSDSSDFNRCVKLLNQVPELRDHLPLMREVSPQWNILVQHWSELESLLTEEIKALCNDRASNLRGSLYTRMKELYATIDSKLFV